MLAGKKIIVAVTGSIAAYKAAILLRLLAKEGAEVRVIMTRLAKEFITPLTLATLSKHPILVEFFNPENGEWNSHISLGEWADAMIIAPATANTIAKMATGVADNLLLTTYLSARCPVFIAPAMDLDMYAHPATQANLDSLRRIGNEVIEPEIGELASGLMGKGRMAEPEDIVKYLESFFLAKTTLKGRKIVVTAGPTVEPIDPVRYISNHSTGKMGYAIANELSNRGAEVVLISGPTSLPTPKGVEIVKVVTAEQMYDAVVNVFDSCECAVMCAAVADYTPHRAESKKIKKNNNEWNIELVQTKDIAAELGRIKGGKLLVGFALETDNERDNAINKLKKKNLDFIVLNSMSQAGAGFGVDTNRITIIKADGEELTFPLKHKNEVATDIVDQIETYF